MPGQQIAYLGKIQCFELKSDHGIKQQVVIFDCDGDPTEIMDMMIDLGCSAHFPVDAAGLDYREFVSVRSHPSLDACLQALDAIRAGSSDQASNQPIPDFGVVAADFIEKELMGEAVEAGVVVVVILTRENAADLARTLRLVAADSCQPLAEALTEAYEEAGLIDLIKPRKEILRAVDSVSFDIAQGEMVGYIGANGAGKSTTIKMLTGILTPTSGQVTVGGMVPWKKRLQYTRHIGAVFGQRTQLWWDLAVVESFRLLKKIYEVDDATYDRQMKLFDELLDIDEFLHQPVRKLSLGQRMRCDLSAALLHRPRVLFLDEPTIGLDVLAKENVRVFLREICSREGVTAILTTHDLGDIAQLCRRVIIIDQGRVHFDGELESLRSKVGQRVRLRLDLRDGTPSRTLEQATSGLPVTWEPGDGRRHHGEFNRAEVPAAEVIRRLVAECHVQDFHLEEAAIEEVVREIYRHSGEPES